jgi:type IX secretion system PorP/SprF family membrane protein
VFVSDDTQITADVAYKLQLSDKFDLMMGVKAGMDFYSVDFSDIILADPNDPLFQGNQSITNPIFGAGVLLKSDNLFLSVSIPNFLGGEQYKLDSDQSVGVEGEIPMSTLIGAGYQFDLGTNFSLTPSIFATLSSGETITDVFLTAGLYQFMDLGGMYRVDNSYSIYGLFHVKDLVDLGYSYNATTGEFQNFDNGSHEIMLKVKF